VNGFGQATAMLTAPRRVSGRKAVHSTLTTAAIDTYHLGRRDIEQIHDLLPGALADCGVTVLDTATATVLADGIRALGPASRGGAGPVWFAGG
jgi:hypothetical protein